MIIIGRTWVVGAAWRGACGCARRTRRRDCAARSHLGRPGITMRNGAPQARHRAV